MRAMRGSNESLRLLPFVILAAKGSSENTGSRYFPGLISIRRVRQCWIWADIRHLPKRMPTSSAYLRDCRSLLGEELSACLTNRASAAAFASASDRAPRGMRAWAARILFLVCGADDGGVLTHQRWFRPDGVFIRG